MLEAKSKKDRLKEISAQLKKASAMHAKQSKAVAKCADELSEAPIVMPGSRISPQSPVGMARSMGARRAMRAPGGMYSGRPAPVTPVPKPQPVAATPVTPKPQPVQPAATATPVTPVTPKPQPVQPAATATPVTPVPKPQPVQPVAATPVTPQSATSKALNNASDEIRQDAMNTVNNNYASSIDQQATDLMIKNIKKTENTTVNPTSNPGNQSSSQQQTQQVASATERSFNDNLFSRLGYIKSPVGGGSYISPKQLRDMEREMSTNKNYNPGLSVDNPLGYRKYFNPVTKKIELPEEVQLDEKCWKGYEKKGMKTMFGKRYPNCVKKKKTRKEEFEVSEGKYSSSVRATYGGKTETFPVEVYKKKTKKVPIADEVQLGEKKDPCWDTHKQVGMKKKGNRMVPNCVPKEQVSDWRSELDLQEKKKKNCGCGKDPCETYGKQEDVKEDWQKANRKDKTDGMSQKAVNAYKRENPGSKLKTAVTGKVKKGSKDAKRRKSFCSRSNGQRKMHNIDCSKTPDKKICKARRRWKC